MRRKETKKEIMVITNSIGKRSTHRKIKVKILLDMNKDMISNMSREALILIDIMISKITEIDIFIKIFLTFKILTENMITSTIRAKIEAKEEDQEAEVNGSMFAKIEIKIELN